MSSVEQELLNRANASGPVSVYCLATLVAEEATRNGCGGFAKSLETALETLLGGLTHDQQLQALRLSYELAIANIEVSVADTEPARPRLRLVYSRD